jgi:hypothetical protein
MCLKGWLLEPEKLGAVGHESIRRAISFGSRANRISQKKILDMVKSSVLKNKKIIVVYFPNLKYIFCRIGLVVVSAKYRIVYFFSII